MSKMAAIDVAVRHQLAAEGRETSYLRTMGDHDPADYGYNDNAIQLFLLNVANRLKLDEPSMIFDWRSLDPGRCRAGDLSLLIFNIASATRPPITDATAKKGGTEA